MSADSTVSDGDEIFVNDPKRRPPDWAKIIQPHSARSFCATPNSAFSPAATARLV
jgi:hypothetical protein